MLRPGMFHVVRISLRKLSVIPAVSAVILMSLISMEINSQDESETCPCFSYEEVESIFLSGAQLTLEEGEISCQAQDYSVESNAEVTVWDQDFTTVAQARTEWFDFDPSGCDYIDSTNNPGVERNIKWPHPAPKPTAKACFDIISNVIAKLDSSGKCQVYP